MNWPETNDGGPLGDGRFARATDRPDSLAELGEVVRRRVAEGHAIYPQGGATALEYGGIPRTPGVAVDLRGLGRIVDYPAADMTITVEAGMTLAAVRAELRAQGQALSVDAPRADRATLGGIFATNAVGPRSFGLGRPRDQVIGVRFVDAEGTTIKGGGRVVKNVAGYDLPKLLTGSMGTLGVLAELTLKVRPLPEASALAWARFRRLVDAAGALDRLNTSATRPVALELLNPPTAGAVGQGALPVEAWVLVVGFEGNAESVAWQVDRLALELGRTDLVIRQGVDAESLWDALTEQTAAGPGPVSFRANLRPSAVPAFCREVESDRWALQAHAGTGVVLGHAVGDPAMETLGPEVFRLRAHAATLGASLTLPRCPTAWKDRLRVWGDPRPDWAVCERVKRALDPRGVLNPGRFVGTI